MSRLFFPTANESGVVIVLVALWLPVLALLTMFAVDTAHWYDYSRNLQSRADAAAFAAAEQYGSICSTPTPTVASMDPIGEIAQLYSGAGASSDLPYLYGTPLATFSAQREQYRNVPNLTAGSLSDYHVLLNSTSYSSASFSMPGGHSFCNVTDETGNSGPLADVRVMQVNLPLFFPLVNIKPTIRAHARVSLQQGVAANNIPALAVRDPSATPCLYVNFVNASTNRIIGSPVHLSPTDPSHTVWQSQDPATGDQVAIPPNANVYVQPVLNDCNGNGETYNDSTNSGLLYINSYPQTTPVLVAGQPPVIASGGVTLVGGCTPDQYFSTQACTFDVTAHVAFAPGAQATTVTAVDTSTGATVPLTDQGGNAWTSLPGPGLTIAAGSGQHPICILVTQAGGRLQGRRPPRSCTGNGNARRNCPCTISLGVQQQAFAACSDCDAPDASGPVTAVQLCTPDLWPCFGTNAFAQGTSPFVDVRVELQGLSFDTPASSTKPTVLRPGVRSDKESGLIDCGQASGPAADENAIAFGCPAVNTLNPTCSYCAPLKVNTRNGTCGPPLRTPLTPVYADCVQRAGKGPSAAAKIPEAIAKRIYNAAAGTCATNNWPAYAASGGSVGIQGDTDPRAVTVVITSAADLSKTGPPVPIQNFATFYITGWGSNPACPPGPGANDPYPGPGNQNGAIWGHWIYYTDPSVVGNGTFCKPTQFGICSATLSR